MLVSTIVRVSGSPSLHLATQNQMRIIVECLQGTMFDWCSGIIPIMKKQHSNFKRVQRKNFGYSSVLMAFFFERVPAISHVVLLLAFSSHWPILIGGDRFSLARVVAVQFRACMTMISTCGVGGSFHH